MGGKGCPAPLSPLFLEVFFDCNVQRVGFPRLGRERRCSALPTHGTQDALESLTQAEESGRVNPASRGKTTNTAAKPENMDLSWKKPLAQFCYVPLATLFDFSGSRLFSARCIK